MGNQVQGARADEAVSRARAVIVLAALWMALVSAGVAFGVAVSSPTADAFSGGRGQVVPATDPPPTSSPGTTGAASTVPPTSATVPPVTDPPVTDPPSTAAPTSAWRPPPSTAAQWVPPKTTVAASTTVTTTEDLLVGPTVSSTTSTTSTTLATRLGSSTTTTGGRSDPKVWAVVAGLGGVGVLLGALTFRFWQRTRPVAGEEPVSDVPADEDDAGSIGGGRRRRGRSRYGDIVITVPEPE